MLAEKTNWRAQDIQAILLHSQEPPAWVPVWGWRACSERIEGDVGKESGRAEKDLERERE